MSLVQALLLIPVVGGSVFYVAALATAFLAADDGVLVIHVVNPQDKAASVALKLSGKFAGAEAATRMPGLSGLAHCLKR